MAGPLIEHLTHTDPLPQVVDTVVIGGGVIGLFTALELAERGQAVAICEKGDLGAEQSSRNWGWIRVARRDAREVGLALESQRLWLALESRLGESVGYTQRGLVYAANTDTDRQKQEAWLDMARQQGAEGSLLTKAELESHFEGARLSAQYGLYCANDGSAEPQLAAVAVAKACRRSGVSVLPHCAARTIETQAGQVCSVATEKGEIRCESVVVAAGAWSSLFLRNLGVKLPQLKVLSSVLRTTATQARLNHALWAENFAVRPRADGGLNVASGFKNMVDIVPDSFRYCLPFLPILRQDWKDLSWRLGPETLRECRQKTNWDKHDITPFEQTRILDPTPIHKHAMDALSDLQNAMPVFADLKPAQVWAGMIDVTPDAIPVISAVNAIPGVFVATGFSGHGFGISPASGCLMADIVLGNKPMVDPHAFRLSRFSDGSRIEL